MHIQAKRLNNDGLEHPDIGRNIGKRVPRQRQIDQLIEVANRYGIPTLYTFYNHLDDSARVTGRCGSLISGDLNRIFGFSISIAEANEVKVALPDQTFDLHRAHSIPLHCLLCTGNADKRGSGGSPDAITANLRGHLRARLSKNRRPTPDPEVLGFTKATHPIVAQARRSKDKLAAGIPAVELDLPDIAGVVVFSDSEDTRSVLLRC